MAQRNYSDALRLLRKLLASVAADPEARVQEDLIQLIRDCSNFDAMGQLANDRRVTSWRLKEHNIVVSKRAFEFMDQCSAFKDWHEAATNEHSTPRNVMQEWLVQHFSTITDEEAMEYFRDNPVCSILKDPEEDLLRTKGWRQRGTIKERYQDVGIQLVCLLQKPMDRKW